MCRAVASTTGTGHPVTSTRDDDRWVCRSAPLSERRPMIRRALLIAAAAVALSAAAAMAFTPGLARAGRSWSRGLLQTAFGVTLAPRSVSGGHTANEALLKHGDSVQGTFCPIRPPAAEQTALLPETSGARMSTDRGSSAILDSSTLQAGDSLPAPAPAICRASPAATPPMQSSDRP